MTSGFVSHPAPCRPSSSFARRVRDPILAGRRGQHREAGSGRADARRLRYRSPGTVAAALPIYERAAAAASGDATAQLRLGDAYTRAGKTDQAIQAYRAVLAVAPDNPDALLGLGSALVKAGDADGAVVALAKVAPIVNTMTAYNRLGVAQTLTGEFAQAHQSSTPRAHSPPTTSISAPISPSPLRSKGRKPRR